MREMKNSGFKWIGEIPIDWEMIPIKYLTSYNDETLAENTAPDFEFDYIEIGSVDYGKGITSKEHLKFSQAPSRARRIVRTNDIILSTVRTYLRAVAPITFFENAQIVSTGFIVIRPKNVVSSFLKYAIVSENFICTVEANSTGISYPAINASQVVQIKIPVPSTAEQQRIASFLDHKCAEIDAVIEKTKATIEEYKKLKQSVITEAVTKGIRGDRPMKDSGVEWIGDIPSEWDVCKTLYALEMPITDGPHTTPELFDKGIPFVSAEAVSCGNGKIDFNHIRGYISEEFYNECCLKYTPKINDIYMIKSGATTGRVSCVDTNIKFNIWSPLAVFRANKDRTYFKFLFYYLQSEAYQKEVQLGWTYGTQQNIGMRTLETLKVVLPSIIEQQEIAYYLDKKCAEIDTLIAKKTALLEEMESYKKSVIYEYVTGKKEVK